MSLKNFFLIISSLALIFCAKAQENNIPLGQWRVHTAHWLFNSIEEFNGKVYVSSDVNAFSVDINEHSIETLSKANGLNDVNITKIRAHRGKNMLLFGYTNGNIDVLTNNGIINISDITRKNIVGSKKINDIIFWKKYAYVCCDFGICVIDLDKFEIKETYDNLAPSGMVNKVNGCAFSANGDSIYLSTARGLMVAKNHVSVNLMDYSNWYTYGAAEGLTTQTKGVICFKSRIYTVTNDDSFFFQSGSTFILSPIPRSGFRSFKVMHNQLILSTGNRVVKYNDENDYQILTPTNSNNIVDAVVDTNGNIWSLDYWFGLYTNNGTSSYQQIQPNCPHSTRVFNLSSFNNSILVAPGGYKTNYNAQGYEPEYYIFDNYSWKNFTTSNTTIPYCKDIVNGVYNPVDQKLYFSAFSHGLLIANNDNTYKLINETNGPFPSMLPDEEDIGNYIFVTYVTVDKAGKVWVCNNGVNSSDKTLHALNTDGTWFSKSFGFKEALYPQEILIDDNDNKWIKLRPTEGGGIIVYNDQTNTYRYLTEVKGQGSLADRSVKAMAKDLKGDIWIATAKGISIFYNPKLITTSGESSQPIFDGFPLLYNEAITSIKVDGGNRKWIGTQNGVWLLSDDGTEVIQYFTSSNSPLLSNYIVDIEINDLTGEVFIGTDKGIISYRGDATAGKNKPDEIKVFPNPVKTGYNGIISISGLSRDAEVKITDIYGTLIYQTKAEGGTAVWRGKNYNGESAAPGVYLIFSASSDGTSGMVGKIAIE